MNLTFRPVTPDRWADFETLFGKNGACGGCWCMSWRLKRKEFDANKGEPNKRAMQAIIAGGEVPGLLAYDGTAPVAWCSVAPRTAFARLQASRMIKAVDDRPVWSVNCFFVAKPYRRQGVTVQLLNAAADYVKAQGGTVLEGYANLPKQELPGAFLWTGIYSAFIKAGFTEAARTGETKAIMRREIS